MKLLLLEDDYLYKVTIQDFLTQSGYEVEDFEEGDAALEAIYTGQYTVLLLDIRVPGKDGYEILSQIRSDGIETPAIILTSLTDIDALSRGYELGCSDYLRKPFELKELQYRIEQVIRTHSFGSTRKLLQINALYQFDIHREQLLKQGKVLGMSAIETRVVSCLVQNMGYFVSMATLQEQVWEGKDITYADIRMCIKRIREKTDKDFIQTKKLVGYRVGA